MGWNKTTLTRAGESLLSSMLNGSKLTFTRVVLGDKSVNEDQLAMQTSVFSPIAAPALIAGKEETPSKNGTTIEIQIRNDGVLETTRMRQIGIFAKTEHSDEVMIGILQDEVGDEIPSYNDFPQFGIFLQIAIGISRTNNINIIVSPFVYVTKAELEAAMKRAGNLKFAVLDVYERDPNKPCWGLDENGDDADSGSVTLRAKTYTGTAAVTLVVDDKNYDAENMKTSAQTAFVGDMIIEEV